MGDLPGSPSVAPFLPLFARLRGDLRDGSSGF
jgi:hypothetical protein